jgi:hypothetical protein
MFGLGVPYVEVTVDHDGVRLHGGLLAWFLLHDVHLPVDEIRFACRAKSKSRFSALKFLGLRTTSQETYLLDFTAGGLEDAVDLIATNGIRIEPGWWLSSPRTGGMTLEPPAEPVP